MLDKYTTPLNADVFQQALFQDRFPVTYSDCQDVATITEEACAVGGYYTIANMANGKGHVLQAFDKDNQIIANFVINRPTEAENRRIPTFPWLRVKFKAIGYDFKDKVIRQTHKQIENHIRDGGYWVYKDSHNGFHIELFTRDQLAASLSYYKVEKFL